MQMTISVREDIKERIDNYNHENFVKIKVSQVFNTAMEQLLDSLDCDNYLLKPKSNKKVKGVVKDED